MPGIRIEPMDLWLPRQPTYALIYIIVLSFVKIEKGLRSYSNNSIDVVYDSVVPQVLLSCLQNGY